MLLKKHSSFSFLSNKELILSLNIEIDVLMICTETRILQMTIIYTFYFQYLMLLIYYFYFLYPYYTILITLLTKSLNECNSSAIIAPEYSIIPQIIYAIIQKMLTNQLINNVSDIILIFYLFNIIPIITKINVCF